MGYVALRESGLKAPFWSNRRFAAALACALALAGLGALFGLGALTSSTHPCTGASGPPGSGAQGDDPYVWTNLGADPFPTGSQEVTYQGLIAESCRIPLPHSLLASPEKAGTVWTISEQRLLEIGLPDAKGNGVAAAVYYPDSGIELIWFPGGLNTGATTPDEYQMIDGVQGLVQAPVPRSHLARIDLAVGAHRLRLEGLMPGVSVAELREVARTLTPSPSSVR